MLYVHHFLVIRPMAGWLVGGGGGERGATGNHNNNNNATRNARYKDKVKECFVAAYIVRQHSGWIVGGLFVFLHHRLSGSVR